MKKIAELLFAVMLISCSTSQPGECFYNKFLKKEAGEVLHFCASEYVNFNYEIGSYVTKCAGIKPFLTDNKTNYPGIEDFDLVTKKLEANGFQFAGAYFKGFQILLHASYFIPKNEFCLLLINTNKSLKTNMKQENYLDCNTGFLNLFDNEKDLNKYLKAKKLQHVYTFPEAYSVYIGNMIISGKIKVFLRETKIPKNYSEYLKSVNEMCL
jgi:hypothetical protein